MTNDIPEGEKIRLARCARRLSVRRLGEMVNLTGGSISLIEQGKVSLKVSQYNQLQAALGYDFNSPEAEAAFRFFLGNNNAR